MEYPPNESGARWRIHLTQVAKFAWGPGEQDFPGLVTEAFTQGGLGTVVNASEAHTADLILVIESGRYKDHRYTRLLERQTWWSAGCPIYTLNYEDDPPGCLPGLYVNLPRARFDPTIHQPSAYWFAPPFPEERAKHALEMPAGYRRFLFSFRGACSHPIRRRIFQRFGRRGADCRVTEVPQWYDHSREQIDTYFEDILLSDFVLCPRGIGTCTHRLFEVMGMGRVPVILSDAWVPVPGIDWDSMALRVPEGRLEFLPAILAARRPQAHEMGVRAREVWQRHFSPQVRLRRTLETLLEWHARSPSPTLDHHRIIRRWRSGKLRRSAGWLLYQRLLRRLRR